MTKSVDHVAAALESPIGVAVLPVKADALLDAETRVRAKIQKVLEGLAAANWDAEAFAPYPNSMTMGRNGYLAAKNKYSHVRAITKSAPGAPAARRMHSPDPRVINAEGIEATVKMNVDAVAVAYDAFVLKLVRKVGEHSAATLEGNHVWGHSVLTVTTPAGVERWKTQMIVNVSKLGLLFNQWPSRKVK